MNILSRTTGKFKFILEDGTTATFIDWNDIPEDFTFRHVIKFQPDYPLPPHTPEDHAEMPVWNGRLTKLMEMERGKDARRDKRG